MTAPPTPAGMPELPGHPEPHNTIWTDDEKRVIAQYGAECYEAGRTAAIERAAQECDALNSIEGIAQRCAAAIRALKGKT